MKNDMEVTLLDCTLRDGGHLTGGVFGELMIKKTIENLVKAGIDIIEIGFLMEESYGSDVAKFRTLEDVRRVLPSDLRQSKISLMADFIDVDALEPYDGTVEYIRLSFKRQRLAWALDAATKLMDKGYKCFINPVNCNVYTEEEYLNVIHEVNKLNPYGFSIVDTFGVLRKSDFSKLYNLVESNLNKEICLGVHLHENLGISFLIAQYFLEIHNTNRKINIDASLLGMGRAPGNLCIEQIMDHMNEQYGCSYSLEPALDLINDYIEPLKEEKKWGYSVPYFLSAKYRLHRTYAEFLMNKWKLGVKDIQRILSNIDRSEAEYFNEEYIEKLYLEYIQIGVDDAEDVNSIERIISNKDILLVAPGSSIEKYAEKIKKLSMQGNVCTFSVGFKADFLKENFVWLSSIKRYNQFDFDSADGKIIITSNIKRDAELYDYIIDFNSVLYHNDVANDNSLLLIMNLLKRMKHGKIFLAGFDGFNSDKSNFYGNMINRDVENKEINNTIAKELERSYSEVDFEFITPSMYDDKLCKP